MNCVKRPPRRSDVPADFRLVGRSSYCWILPHRQVGTLFGGFASAPDPVMRLVPAPLIHPIFEAYFGVGWEKYFIAWKNNFGYHLVPDDGHAGANIVYDANRQWAGDYAVAGFSSLPIFSDPPACHLHCSCKSCPCSDSWE